MFILNIPGNGNDIETVVDMIKDLEIEEEESAESSEESESILNFNEAVNQSLALHQKHFLPNNVQRLVLISDGSAEGIESD